MAQGVWFVATTLVIAEDLFSLPSVWEVVYFLH